MEERMASDQGRSGHHDGLSYCEDITPNPPSTMFMARDGVMASPSAKIGKDTGNAKETKDREGFFVGTSKYDCRVMEPSSFGFCRDVDQGSFQTRSIEPANPSRAMAGTSASQLQHKRMVSSTAAPLQEQSQKQEKIGEWNKVESIPPNHPSSLHQGIRPSARCNLPLNSTMARSCSLMKPGHCLDPTRDVGYSSRHVRDEVRPSATEDPMLTPRSETFQQEGSRHPKQAWYQQEFPLVHDDSNFFPLLLLTLAAVVYWQGSRRLSAKKTESRVLEPLSVHLELEEDIRQVSKDGSPCHVSSSTRIEASQVFIPTAVKEPAVTTATRVEVVHAEATAAPTEVHADVLVQTQHEWAGSGILASHTDLAMSTAEFATGCSLLQATARGDIHAMERLIAENPSHVNFRDYDRRSPLHIAASEGHLLICQMLIEVYNARVNRSDRWGGSPLDDAERHQHKHVAEYLRRVGALGGSASRSVKLVHAANDGDLDEVRLLLEDDKECRETTEMDKKEDISASCDHSALHLA